jgi:uncharacterized protein (UPF0218 family)
MKELAKYLGKCCPKKVIAVGDATVANMIHHDLRVDVLIVDNRVMRRPSEPVGVVVDEVVRVRNPAATITTEAWNAISRVVRGDRTVKVEVEGEEDLLTLPAIICAPQGSVVVYGQPGEGVVAVRVTRGKKAEARRLVDDMPHVDDREWERLK